MTSNPFPPPDPSSAAQRTATPTLPPAGPSPAAPGPALPRSATPASSAASQPPTGSRRLGPLVLALAAVAVVMVVLAAAALPVLQGDDAAPSGAATTASPSTSLALRPQPSAAAGDPAASEPAPAAAVDVPEAPAVDAVETPEVVVDDTATAEAADPEPPAAPEVPESKAVVRGGQIYLEGAVPTVESGEQIAALAAEILGPDNVFNNYVVDPRASDPNLGNVTVEDTINFSTGSSVILPESEGLLNQALALMTIRPSVTVIVVGHTDSRGSDEYNLALSQQRADAVKTWLTDRGIDASRLTVVGKGEAEPIADNATSEGQRLNRRIQFFLENLLADS